MKARLLRVPAAIWAVTALFTLTMVGWSVLTPLGRAADEPVHVDLVLHVADQGGYPDFDGRHPSAATFNIFASYAPGQGLGVGTRRLTPERAKPRDERPTFDEWGGDSAMAWLNQMPQHPPLYYWATAGTYRALDAIQPGGNPAPLDQDWHRLRLLNVAMLAMLPLLGWAAARRMGAGRAAAMTAAIMPLAIPQLTHSGGSVNNDNLLIVLGSILAVLLAGVIRGDDRRSTAGWIAVVATLALLTKTFAVVLLAWVVIAYVYRALTSENRRAAFGLLATAVVPAALIGAVFPVRNLIRHGRLLPSVLDESLATSPKGFEPDPLWYAGHFTSSIFQRFWGNFGFFEAPMPTLVVVIASMATAGAVVAAFWKGSRRRRDLAVFLLPLPMLLIAVAYRAASLYVASGRTPFIQGRYLFSAIIPLAVVVGIGASRVLGRWTPMLMLGAAAAMQTVALWVGLRTWWGEAGSSLHRSVAALVRWSPWPESFLALLVIAMAICGVGTIYLLAGQARSTESTR